MFRTGFAFVFSCCLLIAASASGTKCFAAPQEQQAMSDPAAKEDNAKPQADDSSLKTQNADTDSAGNENRLGMPLIKNLLSDQKSIWTSPSHLRWADGSWLFPLAGATAGLLLTDRSTAIALSNPGNQVRYKNFSNYGLASLVGAGGGLYFWSEVSRDDHQKETGILSGEAAIDSLGISTVLQTSFGRVRPYQDAGRGEFFEGGTSFPSDHAAVAWSIASVMAHEYPGVFTKLAVYGMATAVSAFRVEGQQHFPSDVLVGSAIGWLIGWQVYRTHHNPELGGGGWTSLSGNDVSEDHRDRHNMGSTFVPLDSWVYPAFVRLAGLGYVDRAIMGQKPWTRIECARLTDEAEEALVRDESASREADQLQARLQEEFSYELGLLSGGRNLTANVESLYTRAVSISGPALTDSYHFGQTISYDFGRPFERGTNGQAGGSFSAAAGPVAVYVRAEYQHAPSAPAPSSAALSAIALEDGEPLSRIPSGPIDTTNRLQLLDAYATVNLSNWQLVIGKQSLSWTPGPDGSLLWSDNIEPVGMLRLVNPEPFVLPGLLRHLGPVRIDEFFGRLDGHPYVPQPFVYGQKINIKPFPFLELGFGRRSMIGGKGSDSPLTAGNLIRNAFGVSNGGTVSSPGSVPGQSSSEMDWTFYVPKVRNYIVLYGDAYAEDDILPIENPARNPWHPGIYITRIPGIPKLDFHVEGVSTEQAGRICAHWRGQLWPI